MGFKNFTAAARKRNTQAFGLFSSIPSWIEDNPTALSGYVVTSGPSPVFEATNGAVQTVVVDQDITPIITYSGSQTSGVPYFQMWLKFIQSGGPWVMTPPSNLRIDPAFQIGPAVTILPIWWNGSAWECNAPPSRNPA